MKVLDKGKLLKRMGNRKNVLYDHITRDFGAEYVPTRVYEHSEVKYWKEAIERGVFDSELEEIYIIMTLANEPVDFTFYTDIEVVEKRVRELNGLSDSGLYWFVTLYGNFREVGKSKEIHSL